MSAAKYFLIGGVALFAGIGMIGYVKRPTVGKTGQVSRAQGSSRQSAVQVVQEIALPATKTVVKNQPPVSPAKMEMPPSPAAAPDLSSPSKEGAAGTEVQLPDADRIRQLFATDSSKLPIVETVSYTSRVPWIQGRPAWIADYASHYATSRHFIARSLNKKPDYFTQKIALGDRFNVFKKDKNLQFYLVADLSRCRLWFYYIDLDQNERVLLKTYPISVGRVDPKSPSGFLTPVGKYGFGDKVAIYKPGTMGYYQDAQIEMIRVFGTRWIPFANEIEGCSAPSKGFGVHGTPWSEDGETHQWTEERSRIGKYDTDGCIRLNSEDIEEIFAIVITKPTTIELVKDFRDAKLPGVEKAL